jgi:CBS domain-containing protein
MTPNPECIRADATVREAVALLVDHGLSAAPVIDGGGRCVGVLSLSDIVVHDREMADYPAPGPHCGGPADAAAGPEETGLSGPPAEVADFARAGDIMTPGVLSVSPDTSVRRVVEDLVGLKVYRLYVVGKGGALAGVITALDVLKYLRPGRPKPLARRRRCPVAGPDGRSGLGEGPRDSTYGGTIE